MALDFEQFDWNSIPIDRNSINKNARQKLHAAMTLGKAYLLDGNINDNYGRWVLLIPRKNDWVIASDRPNPAPKSSQMFHMYELDDYEEIILSPQCSKKLFYVLMELYGIKLVDRKSKGGRSSKYTEEDIKEVAELRSQGMSYREIADKKGIPYSTVWTLLEKFRRNQAFSRNPQDSQ